MKRKNLLTIGFKERNITIAKREKEKGKGPTSPLRRKGCLMATTQNSVTRASVLAKALELDVWSPDELNVLSRMYSSITAPRKKPEGPTKNQLVNANLANELIKAMAAHGEPVTAKWIADNVPGIGTSQKAVAVTKAAGSKVERFYEARQAFYRLV